MLIFPVVNTRRGGGVRGRDGRCQTSPQPCNEGVLWARRPRSQGSPQPFPSSALPLTLPRGGSRYPHSFLHLLFLQLGPSPPPPGSLPRLSRWELATCPSDIWQSTHLALTSPLVWLPGMQWHYLSKSGHLAPHLNSTKLLWKTSTQLKLLWKTSIQLKQVALGEMWFFILTQGLYLPIFTQWWGSRPSGLQTEGKLGIWR